MRNQALGLGGLLAVSTALSFGCPKEEAAAPPPETAAAEQPEVPSSASSLPAEHDTSSTAVGLAALFAMPKLSGDGTVAAKVNGEPIPASALENRLRNVQVQLKASGLPQGLSRYDILDGALDDLIDRKLEDVLAKKLDVKVDPKEVDLFLADLEMRMKQNPAFETFLLQAGKDAEQRKIDANEAVLRRGIVREIKKDVEKDIETAAKDYYDRHPRDYTLRGGVQTWRIMIKAPRGMEQRARDAARARAEQIHAKAKKAPDEFENLARTHSEGGKRNEGGFIGYVGTKQYNEAFEKAVYAGKPGEVIPLYEDARGFQIVKVGERRKERVVPFSEVKEEIAANVFGSVVRKELRKRLDELRAKQEVEILIPEYHELDKKQVRN